MNQLMLEEYKSLIEEIKSLAVETRQLELYCAGAVFAIYSWFFTSNMTIKFAWLFPVLIPLLGLIRSWAFYRRIRQISDYIKLIESQYFADLPEISGWESHYGAIRTHGLTPTAIIYWLILILVCCAMPFIFIGYTLK